MVKKERKINPEDDLGFGPQPVIKNQPLMNKDGSPNVRRVGLPLFNTANNYHTLITMSWRRFWLLVLSGYLILNIISLLFICRLGQTASTGLRDIRNFPILWMPSFSRHKPYQLWGMDILVRREWPQTV